MDFLKWFSNLPVFLQWLLMVGTFVMASLSFVQSKGWPIMNMIFMFTRRYLWPGRDAWDGHARPIRISLSNELISLRNEERAFKGPQFWSSMQGQYDGEQFDLDLGRCRTITRIRFLHGHLDNCPKRVELQTRHSDDDRTPITSLHDSSAGIDIQLKPPRKVKHISIIVRTLNADNNEKGEANAWRITDIQLTEVRLLGMIKKVIPE